MLLILDSFEQVIEAASEVSSLVTQAPSLKVVVTSAEPCASTASGPCPLPLWSSPRKTTTT